ncbi:hypothetical protein FSP39_025285 [Pinctada imbricata]|uniref:Fibrinogen C-terminal domain-containing protein n=1 Tax=Pinctada imbricata TaxID=66713 RepID=A0AA89BQB2_PINIB|nr:hypothetical protein FSP39_025285 [Pinctada imbricata]
MDGTGIFYRDWDDYKKGFGKPDKNYWLGNDIIHQLTANRNHELLIVIRDFDDTVRYARYGTFSVGSEKEKYKLNVTGYSGNAGDSLTFHNGSQFSTHDQDNDSDIKTCAVFYKGAWWYKNCLQSNLNAEYISGGTENSTADSYGVVWQSWRGYRYSLKSTVMMVR